MRTEEEVCNHERRVDGTSALREVVEKEELVGVLRLVVLKAPAAPTDDSNSNFRDEIFMVEYYEL